MGLTLYDTTLRDGSQGEGIALSLDDKLKITRQLDRFGIDFIEGGWPGSNPKDEAYFKEVQNMDLDNAKITAFSSSRRPNMKVEEDPNILKLLDAGVEYVTIFSKSWDLHVQEALQIPLAENLAMIKDTISFLKENDLRVFFDAEHFFDGYFNNSNYALEVIKTAAEAGAELLVLCDTNGGMLPSQVTKVMQEIRGKFEVPIGIHAHNDGNLAVANSLAAYEEGAVHFQGTVGGLGERCGNADLCSVIPALQLKYGEELVTAEQLKQLKPLYYFVTETANLIPKNNKPYVGKSAFTHKGGIHVSAVRKNPHTYEHIEPELVGNERRVLVSELAGKSNLLYKLREVGFDLNDFSDEMIKKLVKKVKVLENQGYQFEGAEASLILMAFREFKDYQSFFEIEDFKTNSISQEDHTYSEAVVKMNVKKQKVHIAADGDGPVNALDNCFRKALVSFYPEISESKLIDYKVRVLNGNDGTAAKVRVLIETADLEKSWTTVGVSTNIIQASWDALVDSIEYLLLIKEGARII
ncbi:citramalate synthase [Halanaerobium congolense]|jgi:2-isopropylmalate synthase|uniref:Citramalate synthase n=1 Tax=Halanaerobium congolense TaxID=54121 RepID=A0A1G8HCU7_9FIRM|nr:citramalate synthase [Halanaerobium congolense]TDX45380.1 2-isopropylmalate synthase [Halanaerobium congolense]SDI04508.1 2-isopropylmalate synthase [Halanaerobium congolense]SDK31370.1 2-isopropylmalate synthase [Halanaerobium congolense]SDL95048.1 2-isopropylmalate synthase [Halanaerobium congolense]SET18529.1 2-isopropylmalate synthase [Halanaerobium congolense]